MIKIKRAYATPDPTDGKRYLIDRLWPRGVKKEDLQLQGWLKDVAPSNELRKQFHHDASQWDAFYQHYWTELEQHPSAVQPLVEAARQGDITLVYSARDEHHNNAIVLKDYLEKMLGKKT